MTRISFDVRTVEHMCTRMSLLILNSMKGDIYMIVNVYYRDEETGSVRAGRPYSYRCSIPNASVGMEVIAPTAKREARAVICEIDVPESRIDERILPLLKEITQEAPADGE